MNGRALALAQRLACAFVVAPNTLANGLLVTPQRIALELHGFAKPLYVDAMSAAVRRRAAAGRGLHLIRACGEHTARLRIIDATAGLGRDAFALAWAGADVLLIERDPILAVLLEAAIDALAASAVQVRARVALHCGDARDLLARHFAGHDVVYLDPMFADAGRGLPQREMQMLAQLDRADDGNALLAAALDLAPPRIVVKRGRHQPALIAGAARPHHAIVGKSIRFDVYQTPTKSAL